MKSKKGKAMTKCKRACLTAGAAFAAVLMQSAAVGAESPVDVRIPIVGGAGLSQEKASAARYAEAKDAGFTHLTQWCRTPSDTGRLLAEAGSYADFFWLDPGDVAIFAAP